MIHIPRLSTQPPSTVASATARLHVLNGAREMVCAKPGFPAARVMAQLAQRPVRESHVSRNRQALEELSALSSAALGLDLFARSVTT